MCQRRCDGQLVFDIYHHVSVRGDFNSVHHVLVQSDFDATLSQKLYNSLFLGRHVCHVRRWCYFCVGITNADFSITSVKSGICCSRNSIHCKECALYSG